MNDDESESMENRLNDLWPMLSNEDRTCLMCDWILASMVEVAETEDEVSHFLPPPTFRSDAGRKELLESYLASQRVGILDIPFPDVSLDASPPKTPEKSDGKSDERRDI
eukprot:TRINITY_DN678_c1_g1_i1.p4 TRINITY_DN678_c1_g1~~TRINITY_DN678_c1_g1_i1.p4  ORF type:complete len:109 (-),score=34.93 TRINITY_DN678_c1_g1_i1:138-464(-)